MKIEKQLFIRYIIDSFLYLISFGFAFYIRFFTSIFGKPPIDIFMMKSYFITILIFLPIYLIILSFFDIYEIFYKYSFIEIFRNRFKGVTASLTIFFAASFFIRSFSYSRLTFILIWIFLTIIPSVIQYCLVQYYLYTNFLFIINKDRKEMIKNKLHIFKEIIYVDNIKKEDIEKLIKQRQPHYLFLILEDITNININEINSLSTFYNCKLCLIPELSLKFPINMKKKSFDSIIYFVFELNILKKHNIIIKRSFDIIISLVSLIIFSPLFLLISIALFFEERQIFYLQDRIGKNGKIFKIIKFRTMRKDAEKQTGPIWAKENDPRTTKIGRILRSLSLDEIPQFINILQGEMSLIGPRPERPFFVKEFQQQLPNYNYRHIVKPGLTGWAQVNGLRGNTSIEKRLEYDLYYIYNFTWYLEFKILFKTIMEFLFHKTAY